MSFDVEKARKVASGEIPYHANTVLEVACDEIESLRAKLAEAEEMSTLRFNKAVQWQQERDHLRRRAERLREALEWYADTHHIYLLNSLDQGDWRQQLYTHAFVSQIFLKEVETGQRAREALQTPESETPHE